MAETSGSDDFLSFFSTPEPVKPEQDVDWRGGPEEREHALLSWKIIEWKVAYYRPHLVHETRLQSLVITDDEFEKHERRYLDLCRQLNKYNTVVHDGIAGHYPDVNSEHAMMEIEEDRPSVKLVLAKLSREYINLRA